MAAPRIEAVGSVHAAVLAALHARCFDDAWTPRSMAEVLSSPGVYGLLALGAGAASEPVAFSLTRIAGDDAELLSLAVLPGHRRRGIAAFLLDDAMRQASRSGARSMFLEVEETNDAARALYGTRGFAAVGRRPDYYRRPNRVPVAALILRAGLAVPDGPQAQK